MMMYVANTTDPLNLATFLKWPNFLEGKSR